MTTYDYELSYAGIPFVEDRAVKVRMPFQGDSPGPGEDQRNPRLQQPLEELVDELNRRSPFRQARDFANPFHYLSRNLEGIAAPVSIDPEEEIQIGEWYYPSTASRWSVFRYLATSDLVQAMVSATNGGSLPATFVMRNTPLIPTPSPNGYSLSSSMYMLPPRPLAENGGSYNGLYMVTLVDDRYFFQGTPATLIITKDTTWASLLTQLAIAAGITLTIPTIEASYLQPESDSPLWTNYEDVNILLDAVAFNLGRVVVRNLDGTYVLLTPSESRTRALASRGADSRVIRTAGGDMFTSGINLPVGNITASRNAVIPNAIYVTFPKYIQGNDPVPHYDNSRFANQRPSAWNEASYGSVHAITIPIQSGGLDVSGLTGISQQTFHDTAKALYDTEATAASGMLPLNISGLTQLALQISRDYYSAQVVAALDETYPGTVVWTPEGIHDIIWTWSAQTTVARQARTRVVRTKWNTIAEEMQHATPPCSGTNHPAGVGGTSVAQSWVDQADKTVTGAHAVATISSGAQFAVFDKVPFFPHQNRWKGKINDEIILFEGTLGSTTVGIACRGIDGTVDPGNQQGVVSWIVPERAHGINLARTEKMMWSFPQEFQSGGIYGVNIVPQTQSVRVFDALGVVFLGIRHYSGIVQLYDPTVEGFTSGELIWIKERMEQPVISGKIYDGQLGAPGSADLSLGAPAEAPIYLVNQDILSSGGGTVSGFYASVEPMCPVYLGSGTYTDYDLSQSGVYYIFYCSGPVILQSIKPPLPSSGNYVTPIEIRNGSVAYSSGQPVNTLTLTANDTSGNTTYQLNTVDGGPLVIPPGYSAQLKRDSNSGKNTIVPLLPGLARGGGIPPLTLSLVSGQVQSGNIGNAAVTSGNIASGAIGYPLLGNCAVRSGNICSGQVGWPHVASGAVQSGGIGNQSVTSGNLASGLIGWPFLASGAAQSGNLGAQSVTSGVHASGSIAAAHISSGTIVAGPGITVSGNDTNIQVGIGSGQIVSGMMGPGSIYTNVIASGTFVWLASGSDPGTASIGGRKGVGTGTSTQSGVLIYSGHNANGIMGALSVSQTEQGTGADGIFLVAVGTPLDTSRPTISGSCSASIQFSGSTNTVDLGTLIYAGAGTGAAAVGQMGPCSDLAIYVKDLLGGTHRTFSYAFTER